MRSDCTTLGGDFGHFARILEDIGLANSIPSTVGVESEGKQVWIEVEYENIPPFCKICSSIGHAWHDYRNAKKEVIKM